MFICNDNNVFCNELGDEHTAAWRRSIFWSRHCLWNFHPEWPACIRNTRNNTHRCQQSGLYLLTYINILAKQLMSWQFWKPYF